jgi:hypothetical protein
MTKSKGFYADLTNLLNDELPGFSSERPSTQQLITKLLTTNVKHRRYPEAVSISKALVEGGYFKSDLRTFHSVNDSYKLFNKFSNHSTGAYSCAFMPTLTSLQILTRHLYNTKLVPLREVGTDRVVDKLPKFNKVCGIKVPYCVDINVEELKSILLTGHTLNGIEIETTEYKTRLMHQYHILANTELFGEGMFPQDYKKAPCGRLYGTTTSLQRCPKDIRKAILKGNYDYDMVNCHPALLCNVGDYPHLQAYVDNTKVTRATIAVELGLSIPQVKECLLGLFYGAKVGIKSALMSSLGSIAAQKAFIANETVKNLLSDFNAAGEKILEEGRVKLPKAMKDESFSKRLAFVLQHIESEILKVMCEVVEPLVLCFDGLISAQDVDCELLSARVKEVMNLDIKFSKDLL